MMTSKGNAGDKTKRMAYIGPQVGCGWDGKTREERIGMAMVSKACVLFMPARLDDQRRWLAVDVNVERVAKGRIDAMRCDATRCSSMQRSL